jgi:alkylation response protein AidB-like acyl-CoA dehydrogenase
VFDIRLSEAQREFRDLARKFAQEEIKPNAMALDREPDWEKRVPWDLLKRGSQLGFRTFVPQEENGADGACSDEGVRADRDLAQRTPTRAGENASTETSEVPRRTCSEVPYRS